MGFHRSRHAWECAICPKAPTSNIPPQPDPAEVQRQLATQQLNNSGLYLLKQKNYAGAINEFQKALAISPGDANILHNLEAAKHQLRDAAFADQTSGTLGELLGPAPVQLGSSGTTLSMVNLGSEASVVDLRSATGTTVDPTTLKGQIDNIFSNGEQASAPSDSRAQAQDIDKVFESAQSGPPSPAQGNVDSFNAGCSGVGQGSAADAACQQGQAEQVAAKQKQLDDILNDSSASADFNEQSKDLKDSVADRNAASPSGSIPAGGDNQPTAGGSTNFFGSSNSVGPVIRGARQSCLSCHRFLSKAQPMR